MIPIPESDCVVCYIQLRRWYSQWK